MKSTAIIFGGNINGLSIISELKQKGVDSIILIEKSFNYANLCLGIKKKIYIDYTNTSDLEKILFQLHKEFGYLVLFPTSDLEIEILHSLRHKINDFCFLPFNSENVIQCSDKTVQYKSCEDLGIPYPKTLYIDSEEDISNLNNITFPIIIKPSFKKVSNIKVFRNLILNSEIELTKHLSQIIIFLNQGVSFIISEIIPGDGSNVFAYVGYRSKEGEILNEWIGKKLSQFPDDFGVFASGTNDAPDIIRTQGRKLLEGMDLFGINEPEFKYDERDGQYKLMEINLRSMMWHRVGNLSGVNIQFTQWLDATQQPTIFQKQNLTKKIHFVYLQYEILNLFWRNKYWKTFKTNVFTSNKLSFAELQNSNISTLFYSLSITLLRILKRCLKF